MKGNKTMGQRTAFLIKRTYWNGKVNIRLVHHQWGIGRVMHNHFIKDFMAMITDRSFQDKNLKDFMKIIDEEHRFSFLRSCSCLLVHSIF